MKSFWNPEEFSVFRVDETYDIGKLLVTATYFKHFIPVGCETGFSPTLHFLNRSRFTPTKEMTTLFRYFVCWLFGQQKIVTKRRLPLVISYRILITCREAA